MSSADKRLQFSNTDLFRYAKSRELEAQASQLKEANATGPGGVTRGAHTSDYYRTFNLPGRFDNPESFKGYGTKIEKPMFRTTNSEYGRQAPSVHTMPTSYQGIQEGFTKFLGANTNYRNRSLNTHIPHGRVIDM